MAVPYAHVVLAVISFFSKALKTPMFSSYPFKIFWKANALVIVIVWHVPLSNNVKAGCA